MFNFYIDTIKFKGHLPQELNYLFFFVYCQIQWLVHKIKRKKIMYYDDKITGSVVGNLVYIEQIQLTRDLVYIEQIQPHCM